MGVCGRDEISTLEDEAAPGDTPHKQEELCVFRHDVLFVAKESILVQPDVIHDPTLPRVYDYDCHVCHHNQAVFYRLQETIVSDAMAIIFVCTNSPTGGPRVRRCSTRTPTSGKRQVQYSNP